MHGCVEAGTSGCDEGQVLPDKLDYQTAETLLNDVAAPSADDGAKKPSPFVRMLDQPAYKRERGSALLHRSLSAKPLAEVIKPASKQLVLAAEVDVERRPPDIGAIADVLHADRFPTALENQSDECFLQRGAGSLHPAVAGVRCLHARDGLAFGTDCLSL